MSDFIGNQQLEKPILEFKTKEETIQKEEEIQKNLTAAGEQQTIESKSTSDNNVERMSKSDVMPTVAFAEGMFDDLTKTKESSYTTEAQEEALKLERQRKEQERYAALLKRTNYAEGAEVDGEKFSLLNTLESNPYKMFDWLKATASEKGASTSFDLVIKSFDEFLTAEKSNRTEEANELVKAAQKYLSSHSTSPRSLYGKQRVLICKVITEQTGYWAPMISWRKKFTTDPNEEFGEKSNLDEEVIANYKMGLTIKLETRDNPSLKNNADERNAILDEIKKDILELKEKDADFYLHPRSDSGNEYKYKRFMAFFESENQAENEQYFKEIPETTLKELHAKRDLFQKIEEYRKTILENAVGFEGENFDKKISLTQNTDKLKNLNNEVTKLKKTAFGEFKEAEFEHWVLTRQEEKNLSKEEKKELKEAQKELVEENNYEEEKGIFSLVDNLHNNPHEIYEWLKAQAAVYGESKSFGKVVDAFGNMLNATNKSLQNATTFLKIAVDNYLSSHSTNPKRFFGKQRRLICNEINEQLGVWTSVLGWKNKCLSDPSGEIGEESNLKKNELNTILSIQEDYLHREKNLEARMLSDRHSRASTRYIGPILKLEESKENEEWNRRWKNTYEEQARLLIKEEEGEESEELKQIRSERKILLDDVVNEIMSVSQQEIIRFMSDVDYYKANYSRFKRLGMMADLSDKKGNPGDAWYYEKRPNKEAFEAKCNVLFGVVGYMNYVMSFATGYGNLDLTKNLVKNKAISATYSEIRDKYIGIARNMKVAFSNKENDFSGKDLYLQMTKESKNDAPVENDNLKMTIKRNSSKDKSVRKKVSDIVGYELTDYFGEQSLSVANEKLNGDNTHGYYINYVKDRVLKKRPDLKGKREIENALKFLKYEDAYKPKLKLSPEERKIREWNEAFVDNYIETILEEKDAGLARERLYEQMQESLEEILRFEISEEKLGDINWCYENYSKIVRMGWFGGAMDNFNSNQAVGINALDFVRRIESLPNYNLLKLKLDVISAVQMMVSSCMSHLGLKNTYLFEIEKRSDGGFGKMELKDVCLNKEEFMTDMLADIKLNMDQWLDKYKIYAKERDKYVIK